MSDIRYQWNDGINSVQISSDVSLPQFKVLGHRQKTIEASLSTGSTFYLPKERSYFVLWDFGEYFFGTIQKTSTYIDILYTKMTL